MKREIKFRAWAKIKKPIMIYSGEDLGNFFDHQIHDFESELMQFTGLLDKNGKEIYEGDIIDVQDDFIKDGEKKTRFKKYYLAPTEIYRIKNLNKTV